MTEYIYNYLGTIMATVTLYIPIFDLVHMHNIMHAMYVCKYIAMQYT